MRINVEFSVQIPVENVTTEQIQEWLRFELNDNGSIELINPLAHCELEALQGSIYWTKA